MNVIREYMSKWSLDLGQIQSDFEELDELVSRDLTLEERASLLDIIEAGSGEKYLDLVELISEIEEAGADRVETLLTEDGLRDEVETEIDNADVPSFIVIDMEATKDNLIQDYTEYEIDGYTFYSR